MKEKYNILKKENIYLAIILLIGAILRIYKLGSKSFWFDETIEATVITSSFDTVMGFSSSLATSPPLSHIIFYFWSYLGTSDFTLRLLSALIGIFSIYLVYILSKNLFNKKVGILTALLISISPFHLFYSQEFRMYSLAIFFILLSTYFLIRLLNTNKNKYFIAYIISVLLSLYTHYYTFYFILATNLFFFYKLKTYKVLLKNWLLSNFIIFILFLPWLSIAVRAAMVFSKNNIPILVKLTSPTLFYEILFTLTRIPSVFRSFAIGGVQPYFWNIKILMYVALLIYAFIILKYFISTKDFFKTLKIRLKDKKILFLLFILFVPFVIGAIINPILTLPFNDKYFIMTAFPFYILLVKGIYSFKNPKFRAFLFIILIVISMISIQTYYAYEKPDWRGAAKYVESNSNPNEIVLVSVSWAAIAFKYYYKGDLTVRGIPSDRFNLTDSNLRKNNKINETNVGNIENLIGGYDGVWLIFSRKSRNDPNNLTLKWMDERYQRTELYFAHKPDEFAGIEVYNYKLK